MYMDTINWLLYWSLPVVMIVAYAAFFSRRDLQEEKPDLKGLVIAFVGAVVLASVLWFNKRFQADIVVHPVDATIFRVSIGALGCLAAYDIAIIVLFDHYGTSAFARRIISWRGTIHTILLAIGLLGYWYFRSITG